MAPKSLAYAALIAVLCPLAACLAPASDSAPDEVVDRNGRSIIGGSKASAYPEAILLDLYKGGQLQGYCSASLIAPQVVLTAGHCVFQFDSWNVTAPYAG